MKIKGSILLVLFSFNLGDGSLSMEEIDQENIELNSPIRLDNNLVVTIVERPEVCTRRAKKSDVVTVDYTGRFNDSNGEIFETNKAKGDEYKYNFQLGRGRVIEGYELGAPGICVGETRTFLTPPELAYGSRGSGKIPPNATLHFTVTCTSIRDGELPPPPKIYRTYEVS